MTPSTHTWTGAQSALWSDDRNWNGNSPYGDPSAQLVFDGSHPQDTIHDFTGPMNTAIESIEFRSRGYSLSAAPGASDIVFTGDIVSHANGGTNAISLGDMALGATGAAHIVQVDGGDTIVLSSRLHSGFGEGEIVKRGPGTLVLSGTNDGLQSLITVQAGTVQLGSDHSVGIDERITVMPGTVFDLNNHNASLIVEDHDGKAGEIRLGNANLTLKHHQLTTIDGVISGTGSLTLDEDASVWLEGTETYTGPTRLLSGKLEIDGSAARSPITISAGTVLYGTGTTGPLSVSGLVQPGGVPNGSFLSAGTVRSNGDVSFLPGSSLAARISDNYNILIYDQLNVAGSVDLSGMPTLEVSVDSYPLVPGEPFTILKSTGRIIGTFAGLPDGTNFTVNGVPLQINYTANSVVLTRPQFLPPVPYSAGRGPYLVTTADLRRGVHTKDLVTASYSDASVNVLLGNGDGTFRAPVRYALPGLATSLTVGDFNGDGALDLVTVELNAGTFLSVLLGNGDGTFQDAVTYPLDSQVVAVAAGDLLGNGISDLVTANGYDRTFSVLLSNGDGTFQPAVTYPVGSFAGVVALIDLNGDHKLDLVLSKFSGVSVLLGNGDGTFQAAQDFPTSGYTSIAFGDFDGDGKLDLIGTANSAFDSSVYILLGNGDGTFGTATRIFVTDQPGNVAVGDFDGDGMLDFVVTTNYPSNRGVALVYGQGDGTFRAPSYYFPGQGFSSLVAGSFRDPHFPDLAVINADPSTGIYVVSVLLNVGDGGPPPAPPPGGSGQRNGPHTPIEFFPADGFPRMAGVDAALQMWPSSQGTPGNVTPSSPAETPRLEVAGVEQFFAAATGQDHGFAWPRSKRDGLRSGDGSRLADPGQGGVVLLRQASIDWP